MVRAAITMRVPITIATSNSGGGSEPPGTAVLLAVEAPGRQRLLPRQRNPCGAEHRIHRRSGAAGARKLTAELPGGGQQAVGRYRPQPGQQVQAAAQAEDLDEAPRVPGRLLGVLREQADGGRSG